MLGQGDEGSFRTAQAVADLVHHIGSLMQVHFAAVAAASGLSPAEAGAALALLRDDGFAFQRNETRALMGGLEDVALAGEAGFDLAVVVLLADLLQRRQGSGLMVWQEACERLKGWPDTLRAAVANGLLRAEELHQLHLDLLPRDMDGLTCQASEITEQLVQIARSMRRHELEGVARADYGQNSAAYLEALIETIARRDGVFPTVGLSPHEVVSLVSFDPGSTAFAGCTAILLINDLREGCGNGFHWEKYAAAYLALPPSQRDPILAAFRHLYELDRLWLPETDQTIPVVEQL